MKAHQLIHLIFFKYTVFKVMYVLTSLLVFCLHMSTGVCFSLSYSCINNTRQQYLPLFLLFNIVQNGNVCLGLILIIMQDISVCPLVWSSESYNTSVFHVYFSVSYSTPCKMSLVCCFVPYSASYKFAMLAFVSYSTSHKMAVLASLCHTHFLLVCFSLILCTIILLWPTIHSNMGGLLSRY